MHISKNLLVSAVALFSVSTVQAAMINSTQSDNLSISVYNNNLAFVRDARKLNLKNGINQIAFEGVSAQIKPESVIIQGQGINVLEQNYDYNLMTAYNILQKSAGESVKTVMQNPTTGENVFDRAKILSTSGGMPVLEFSYGIETNFPGRIVFEKIPEGLRQKPTLEAKISFGSDALSDLTLAYLTNGISWKTNYIAEVKTPQTLDLTAWVTINNQSGTTYENAQIQLVAGEVNEVSEPKAMYRMANKMMAMGAVAETASDAGVVETGNISGYHLYTLPLKTTLNENQSKQIALLEKKNVAYQKEGRITSNLYLGGDYTSSFEKIHPQLYYVMENVEKDNLGVALPSGIVRFYENDSDQVLQFIGENSVSHVAKGEKIELNIGSLFDVFVNGKITDVTTVSEDEITDAVSKCPRFKTVKNYNVEVVFHNGGQKAEKIVFVQNINQKTKIIQDNSGGQLKNANQYEWTIDLAPETEVKLNFTAQVTSENVRCR